MRGAGSPGVVEIGRAFLGRLSLHRFGTSNESEFRSQLDATTMDLLGLFPKGAQFWGRARKGANIFLRDCLYTIYIRDNYELARAEHLFEVPLDSITGTRLAKASDGTLPRWKTVRGLTRDASAAYQAVAARVAAEKGLARVHLDAMWWGERERAELTGHPES
jgi:hypothetical protein